MGREIGDLKESQGKGRPLLTVLVLQSPPLFFFLLTLHQKLIHSNFTFRQSVTEVLFNLVLFLQFDHYYKV